jgi:hypothetical protein
MTKPDKNDVNYAQLCRMRTTCDKLNDAHAKYYSLTENLAVHEITALFTHSHIIHQRNKKFGMKIYKVSDSMGYTYSITLYLRKDWKRATATMAAT